ncbi:MAG: hypothetical protein P8H17_02460, partial [Flavobacteriales bacterium]|nr:hypothetical protein [Flavobacteriales bacterium]
VLPHTIAFLFLSDNSIYSIFIFFCTVPSSIQEQSTNKELLKVTDILGREVNEKRNTPLFYIYDDGTVQKKINIE